MKNPAIEIDYFFNEVRVKQLLGILKNSRTEYRAAMCQKSLHPVFYDIMRKYNPVNWHLICLEFPHIAKDGISVGYYSKSDNVGKTVTTCKIGKYVKRHFPQLQDHTLRDYVNPYVVKAEFIDDIERIIEIMESDNVPASCMTKSSFSIHPYRIYNPEFGWKMVVKKSGNDIIGRALINGNNYVRAYTTSTSSNTGISIDCALENWLDSQGYECKTSWPEGTKVAKIETNYGGIVAPYIDGNRDQLEDCGSYMRIVSDGDYEASSTDGLAEELNRCTCDACGGRIHEEDSTYIERDDISVCESCLNREYTYIPETRSNGRYPGGYYVNDNDLIETVEGDKYPNDKLCDFNIIELHDGRFTEHENTIYDELSGDYYHSDEMGENIAYCEDVGEYRSDFWQCAESDNYYSEDESFAYNTDGDKIHPDYASEELELVTETNGA